ncbi:MAG: hypothetical protein M0R28_09295 [Pigmentiphaga sp.]|nr:hypothetical protein [Pigmentiphaga sp.]
MNATVPGQAPSAFSSLVHANREAALPRSGLYPAPEHYSEAYTALHHQHTLAACRTGGALRPLGLLVQVPFCRSLCRHCSRDTLITHEPQRLDRYLGTLRQELQLVADMLAAPTPLLQLHLGGGTPTLLKPQQLAPLLEQIHSTFPPASELRPSIEVDPRHATPARLKELAQLGFRTLYVTLPDIDAVVQEALDRRVARLTPDLIIHTARLSGFQEIRIEVLAGLPHQTPHGLQRLLRRLVDAGPDGIRLSSYWHQPHLHPAQRLIDPATLADGDALLRAARHQLLQAGLHHLGLDRFVPSSSTLRRASLEGRLRLDCLDYQAGPEVDRIGLGLGAISRVGRSHAQNTRDLQTYADSVAGRLLPIRRGHVMSADDLARHAIIQGLFCQGEVDFQALAEDHLLDVTTHFRHEWRELEALAKRGWIWLEADGFGATASGRFELPRIAAVFDRYGRSTRQWLLQAESS